MNLIALTEAEAAIVAAFTRSPEYLHARLPYRPIWVAALLDCMTACDWTWPDLDLPTLRSILCDGMGWTIAARPRDPAAVARELETFLRWAGRVHGFPHAAACCAYLRSAAAAGDITRWLIPVKLVEYQRGRREDQEEVQSEAAAGQGKARTPARFLASRAGGQVLSRGTCPRGR